MNPYESPQTIDKSLKEKLPKRKLTWGEIATIAAAIGVSQLVLHYFRAEARDQRQAELIQQVQPAFPRDP